MTTLVPPPEQTIRRWRRIFGALYLVFTVGAILLTFASILTFHCGARPFPRQGPRIGEHADIPEELRSCLKDLSHLLTDLHKETFTLQAKALRFDTDPAAEWRNWSADWRLRWQKTGWRCRLQDLSGTGQSPIIDQMADIHLALDELQHAYNGIVDRFVETYLDRLHKLKGELSAVLFQIDKQKLHAPQPHSVQSGARR